jgi:hypothetical protein
MSDNPFNFDEQERPSRSREEVQERSARRSRRDYDEDDPPARPGQGGGSAKVLAILSIVFFFIPLVSYILAGIAGNQVYTALNNLPRGARCRAERQRLESVKTLLTIGVCLATGVIVLGVALRFAGWWR